jgi:glycosyltransferase involved in cell wall biosynthesis
MRISIAMATYNGAQHLQAQLDSFRSQTRQPDELVVCDDGSIDATLDIVERFRQKARFDVRLHRNATNLGFTKNFEKALSNCSGDVIMLSDQDDVWFPNKLDVLEKVFLAKPEKLVVVHDGQLVDEHLVWHGATKLGQILAGIGSANSLIMGALTAIQREFLSYALPIPDGIVGHDVWLHNIAQLLDTRLVINKPLQSIRRHTSNTSNWIASSVRQISELDVWRSQFKTVAAIAYDDRLRINKASQHLLKRLLHDRNNFPRGAIEKSLAYLGSEQSALNYRSRLATSSWPIQKIMSLRMLLSGDYQFFNGYKSFFRDITR